MKTNALSQSLMRVAPFLKVAFVTGEKLVMLGDCFEEIDGVIHYDLIVKDVRIDLFTVTSLQSASVKSDNPMRFPPFTILGRILNRFPRSNPMSRFPHVENFAYFIYGTYLRLLHNEEFDAKWFPTWIVERYRQYRITFKSGTYFTYYSERCLREGKYLRFQVLVEGQPNFWFTTLKIPLKLVSKVEETGS